MNKIQKVFKKYCKSNPFDLSISVPNLLRRAILTCTEITEINQNTVISGYGNNHRNDYTDLIKEQCFTLGKFNRQFRKRLKYAIKVKKTIVLPF